MTDDTDTMRDALRAARPSSTARTRGIEGAMDAFDTEFSAQGEKNAPPVQGSDAGRRLTSRKARTGRAEPRRSKMSRLSSLTMAVGGTGIAAVLALFVVMQTGGDRPFTLGPWADREVFEPSSEISELAAPEFETPAIARDDSKVAKVLQDQAAPTLNSRVRQQPIEAEIDAIRAPSISVEALGEPASVHRAAEARGTATIQTRVIDQQITVTGSAAKRAQDSFAALPAPLPAPAAAAQAPQARAGRVQDLVATPPLDNAADIYRDVGRDRFADFEPNPVVSSRETPVSTFSIDVDTASYSYLRRALNGGHIPPARAIRIEELVNYFPYDYLGSDSASEPFKANISVVPTPWNADTQLMHIGIKGYVPPAAERPRANIVLLIDTSGSMNAPDKLPLLINSFRLLLDTLDEDDTVSIVTYAGSAGTVLEPTAASERSKIEQAFDRLRAGGSTAGAAGLRLAYDKAQESFDAEAVNRVILATDGDFNVGFSSPEAMKEYVEKKRETGVFLSV